MSRITETQTARKLRSQTTDIIDALLPTRRVHLIAGPVGVGKTTLILQMLDAIVNEQPFLGMATRRVPIVYIAADHTAEEFQETTERLKIDLLNKIKFVAMEDYKSIPLLLEVLNRHAMRDSLVIVEPLPFFLTNNLNQPGNANDVIQVSRFLHVLKRECKHGCYTLFGSCHSSKSREGSNYSMVREKIAGSYAWGAFSHTDIVIENQDPEDPRSPYRKVSFMYRNEAPQVLQFKLAKDTGLFELCEEGKSKCWDALDRELQEWPLDEPLPTAQIGDWAELVACGKTTLKKWIQAKLDDGLLERTDRGVYRRLRTN